MAAVNEPIQKDWRAVMVAEATSAVAAMQAATSAQSMASQASAAAAAAQNKANAAEALAKLSRIEFGQFTIAYQALISLNARMDEVTLSIPGALVNDRLLLYSTNEGTGYALLTHARKVTVAGSIVVKVWRPALAIATNVSFTIEIIGYRSQT